MTRWRLCRRVHAPRAFGGEGARRHGGRWNHRGTAVVYVAETLSLAVLELLVNADPDTLPDDLVSIPVEIPDDLAVERVEVASLPRGWRSFPAPEAVRERGTEWARSGRTAVLSVPSAVVPRERNFLLNPAHRGFGRIRSGRPEPFALDPRLFL